MPLIIGAFVFTDFGQVFLWNLQPMSLRLAGRYLLTALPIMRWRERRRGEVIEGSTLVA